MTSRRAPFLPMLVAVLLALGIVAGSARAAAPTPTRLAKKAVLQRGADWLQAQQTGGGGYPALDGQPDPGVTAETVLALVALQHAGIEVDLGDAVDYMVGEIAGDPERVAGGVAKTVLALTAAGADPRDADGVDLVAEVVGSWDGATAMYGLRPLDNVLSLLALAATGEPIEGAAVDALLAAQIEDGSWAFGGGTASGSGDTNMTSYVVQALVATGDADDAVVDPALAYLKATQTPEGAFPSVPGAPADANSTGFVVSALVAAGENPKSGDWGNAAGALIAFQNESGAFRYTDAEPADDILATLTALTALAGGGLAVAPVD